MVKKKKTSIYLAHDSVGRRLGLGSAIGAGLSEAALLTWAGPLRGSVAVALQGWVAHGGSAGTARLCPSRRSPLSRLAQAYSYGKDRSPQRAGQAQNWHIVPPWDSTGDGSHKTSPEAKGGDIGPTTLQEVLQSQLQKILPSYFLFAIYHTTVGYKNGHMLFTSLVLTPFFR